MDLHVIGPLASPAERAAVDGVLGPPESGWVGGPRRPGVDGHAARGGHAVRARRSQLLPALHAVQDRIGWISQPALNYISRRLAVPPAEAYGVATFYALYSTKPRPPVMAHVCDDIACRLAGAERICEDLGRAVGPAGEAARDGRVGWHAIAVPRACATWRRPRWSRPPASRAAVTSAAPVDAAGIVARLDGAAVTRPPPPAPQAGDRVAPAAATHRRRRPVVARRLPRARRLRRAATALEIGPGGRHRRGHRVEADGPRRGGVPDRPQVGRGRRPAGPAALPRLQRRRVGARHVQGSRAARGRPVRDRRGDDDRRVRDRCEPGLPLHPRRVPRGRGARPRRDRRRARRRPARRRHPRLGLRLRHRGPARRRRLHLRRGDGALRVDRGQARRAAQQAAVPGRGRAVRQADRRQQRRDPGQRPAHPRDGRRGVRRDRHGGLDRAAALLPVRPRRAARRLRGRVRGDAARPDRARRRRPRRARRSGRSCSAARPACSSGPTRSTCR